MTEDERATLVETVHRVLQEGALSAPEGAVILGEVLALWMDAWGASPAQRALLCETVIGTASLMSAEP